MFQNFFRTWISLETRDYSITARYRTGDWMRRFTLSAGSSREACRTFDQDSEYKYWTRVSGATTDEV